MIFLLIFLPKKNHVMLLFIFEKRVDFWRLINILNQTLFSTVTKIFRSVFENNKSSIIKLNLLINIFSKEKLISLCFKVPEGVYFLMALKWLAMDDNL